MKTYKTIKQFQDRLTTINRDYNQRFKFNDPTMKEVLLFSKRRQICERNLNILYRRARLGDSTNATLNELYHIHRQLTAEILKISTVNHSWELRAMVNQLYTVTETIQTVQSYGIKVMFIQKVKRFLKRLKII